MPDQKTAIITGASRGIGAGLVGAFLKQGYNVVATSRNVSQQLTASTALALIDGDIGKPETAAKVVEAAIKNFGSIDVLVSNAGIFCTKPFTEFSTADFNALVSTNLLGFLYITQRTVKQMLKQKSGSVVSITAALADQPILGVNGSVPMITKGGLNSIIRSLAIEYAKQGIRFNAVAPGVVDTPMHKDNPKDFLKTLQPMGKIADVKDVADAVLYLAQAGQVTGEVLHVDGGVHAGRWQPQTRLNRTSLSEIRMTSYQKTIALGGSTQEDMKVRYTAKTHTSGGRRGGVSRSDDGRLDVKFSAPGVPGTGTNPEQLFAAGWSACFISAMALVANRMKVALPADAAIDAEIDLCNSGDVYFLRARLNVSLPGLERELAQAIVDATHAETCAYSNATRGNIDVTVKVA